MRNEFSLANDVLHPESSRRIMHEISCPSTRNQYGELLKKEERAIGSNGDVLRLTTYEDTVVIEFKGIRFPLSLEAFSTIDLDSLETIDPLQLMLKLNSLLEV